jgi:murein lipoprotein
LKSAAAPQEQDGSIIRSTEHVHSRTESHCSNGSAQLGASQLVNHKENSMSPTLTKLAPVAVILMGSLALSGCATKGFVREQVATVNQRVDALDAKLQETDGTAKQALAEAQSASGQAQNNGQRLDQLNARVDGVEQRMQQAQRKRPRN